MGEQLADGGSMTALPKDEELALLFRFAIPLGTLENIHSGADYTRLRGRAAAGFFRLLLASAAHTIIGFDKVFGAKPN
jgi:hypothetical protein